MGNGIRRVAMLYFPDTEHTITHGGSQSITYAGIARMNMLDPGSKWMGFLDGVRSSLSGELDQLIDAKFQRIYSGEVDYSRKMWNFALRRSGAKAALERFRRNANAAKEKYLRLKDERDAMMSASEKKRELKQSVPKNLWGYMIDEWIEAQMSDFKLKKSVKANEVRSAKAAWTNLNSHLKSLKAGLAEKYATQIWKDKIEKLSEILEFAQVSGSGYTKNDIVSMADQIAIMKNPWIAASTLSGAAEAALNTVKEYAKDAILGGKGPALAPRTIVNRQKRGYDDTPLAETGEFAESLEAILL